MGIIYSRCFTKCRVILPHPFCSHRFRVCQYSGTADAHAFRLASSRLRQSDAVRNAGCYSDYLQPRVFTGLQEMIETMNPGCVIPIQTEQPKLFKAFWKKTIMPAEGTRPLNAVSAAFRWAREARPAEWQERG